jgi:hypothetical protein
MPNGHTTLLYFVLFAASVMVAVILYVFWP